MCRPTRTPYLRSALRSVGSQIILRARVIRLDRPTSGLPAHRNAITDKRGEPSPVRTPGKNDLDARMIQEFLRSRRLATVK